jgi:hypothetical protein
MTRNEITDELRLALAGPLVSERMRVPTDQSEAATKSPKQGVSTKNGAAVVVVPPEGAVFGPPRRGPQAPQRR